MREFRPQVETWLRQKKEPESQELSSVPAEDEVLATDTLRIPGALEPFLDQEILDQARRTPWSISLSERPDGLNWIPHVGKRRQREPQGKKWMEPEWYFEDEYYQGHFVDPITRESIPEERRPMYLKQMYGLDLRQQEQRDTLRHKRERQGVERIEKLIPPEDRTHLIGFSTFLYGYQVADIGAREKMIAAMPHDWLNKTTDLIATHSIDDLEPLLVPTHTQRLGLLQLALDLRRSRSVTDVVALTLLDAIGFRGNPHGSSFERRVDAATRYSDRRESASHLVDTAPTVNTLGSGIEIQFDDFGDVIGFVRNGNDVLSVEAMVEELIREGHAISFEGDEQDMSGASRITALLLEQNAFVRKGIEEDFGIHFSEMSFREQYTFFQEVLYRPPSERRMARRYLQEWGTDGVSLLVMKDALTWDLGLNFEQLTEKLQHNPESASLTHAAHTLLELAEHSAQEIASEVLADVSGNHWKMLRTTLYEAAVSLIAQHLDSGEYLSRKEIDAVENGTKLFTEVLKHYRRSGGEVHIDELQSVSVDTCVGSEISQADFLLIADRHQEIWRALSPELADYLQKTFEEKVMSGESEVVTLKRGEDLVGAMRLDPVEGEPDTVHAASLILFEQYQHISLGESFFETVVHDLGKTKRVVGEMHAKHKIGSQHVENVGFVMQGVIRNVYGTKEDAFDIVFDRALNEKLRGPKLEEQQVLAGDVPEGLEVATFNVADELDYKRFLNKVEEVVADGNVVSRYIAHGDKGNTRTLLIEPRPEEQVGKVAA